MKKLICNKCNKTVDVDDGYNFKRCPNCRTKDQIYSVKKRELRNFDKQSKKFLKELKVDKEKLKPEFRKFSAYYYFVKKYWKDAEPKFEDYEKAVRKEKLSIAHEQSDLEITRNKTESKKLLAKLKPFIEFNDVKGKDCRSFRLAKLCEKFKIKTNIEFDVEHDCDYCQDWLFNFNSGVMFSDFDVVEKQEVLPEDKWGTDLGVEFDRTREDLGIEKQSNKPKPQFSKEKQSNNGFNAWQEPEATSEPKESVQDKFRKMFDDNHSE